MRAAITAVVLARLVAACAGRAPAPLAPVDATPTGAAAESTASDTHTRLGAGDTLRVTVVGEEALSGEFEVGDAGTVSLPLVGEVGARDRTLRGFVEEVAARLRQGHVKDPQVRAELLNYRPFYVIFCDAEKGGEYPFVSGVPAVAAASLAGGSAYRARASEISIIRRGQDRELSVTPDTQVQPGDLMLVACEGDVYEPTTLVSATSRAAVPPVEPVPADRPSLPPVSAVGPRAASAAPASEGPTEGEPVEPVDVALAYRLGSGDKVRVIVFGEEDLSGEFEVDGSGTVALPLIGEVRARDRTMRAFETAVEAMLRDGYLKDPRVSAEVLNYRPFYIIGEVEKGGEYPFVSGMHVLNAVARAGGHTYRANPNRVFITRRGEESEFSAPLNSKVQPGDVIRVPERFF